MGPIRTATHADLDRVSEALARWQAAPATHIAYLSTDAYAIRSELEGLVPEGVAVSATAWEGQRVTGFLAAEWDRQPPRVWWHGPFVEEAVNDGGDVAYELYQHARALLPLEIVEEELAADDRNGFVRAFAFRHGFVAGEASSVLSRWTDSHLPSSLDVRSVANSERDRVAALHDALFPDTHTPGDRLVGGDHEVVLVAVEGEEVAGYVAARVEADGSGYIDYMGVQSEHRRRGIGLSLIAGCVGRLAELGCRRAHLTVRADNTAARRLYAEAGFVEDRVLRPYRKGFSLR